MNNNDMKEFAEIAIRILNYPCSENPLERLFSHLKYLYGPKNINRSEDLLNAQLSIKMYFIYSEKK